MICKLCAEAADALVDPPVDQVVALHDLAVRGHKACPGGSWCDCQHLVPPVAVIAGRAVAPS